jgi:DNA-binding protein HU-beta
VYKIYGGKNMNKVELVAAVTDKTGLTKKDAEKAVSAVLESVVEAVATGNKVQLVGFGTFETRSREERTGRNPRTKETIIIPASKQPVFKAGKAFKEAVQE